MLLCLTMLLSALLKAWGYWRLSIWCPSALPNTTDHLHCWEKGFRKMGGARNKRPARLSLSLSFLPFYSASPGCSHFSICLLCCVMGSRWRWRNWGTAELFASFQSLRSLWQGKIRGRTQTFHLVGDPVGPAASVLEIGWASEWPTPWPSKETSALHLPHWLDHKGHLLWKNDWGNWR